MLAEKTREKQIIVQKFGGTSVADTDKIKRVADAVIKEKEQGNDVVVVVSAMGHTTDYLIKLANEISPNPSGREMDVNEPHSWKQLRPNRIILSGTIISEMLEHFSKASSGSSVQLDGI